MKTCPICRSVPSRVIYSGLPALLCSNDECRCLYGFWSYVIALLPFNGVFYVYGEGQDYLQAVVSWWKGVEDA